LKRSNS